MRQVRVLADVIDHFFWMNSDWAYFGNPRLKRIAEHYGLVINQRPIDMKSVYSRTGGTLLPLRSKERRDYRLLEMRRFRDILNMPIALEPKFATQNVSLPSRFVIAAIEEGAPGLDLIHAVMTDLWVNELDIENPETLIAAAVRLGIDGVHIFTRCSDKDIEALYFGYTDEAVARGVFGAPFYFFRGEAFWGQDRLEMLDATIARALGNSRAL